MRSWACLHNRVCNVLSCSSCSTKFLHCYTAGFVVYFDLFVGSFGCSIGTVGCSGMVDVGFVLYLSTSICGFYLKCDSKSLKSAYAHSYLIASSTILLSDL
ncbi:hypothetical protein BpHYR1_013022 [Brachionus plicatilis]|uniref:Uncharacterized protein n=1 Tax=Brachionus plicatilis TaxID=10195 RepID=A0A3M7R2C5_BRAPC|nr:hypothetical protein BpHYR1_013022 [Brachionus plicatilis]